MQSQITYLITDFCNNSSTHNNAYITLLYKHTSMHLCSHRIFDGKNRSLLNSWVLPVPLFSGHKAQHSDTCRNSWKANSLSPCPSSFHSFRANLFLGELIATISSTISSGSAVQQFTSQHHYRPISPPPTGNCQHSTNTSLAINTISSSLLFHSSRVPLFSFRLSPTFLD